MPNATRDGHAAGYLGKRDRSVDRRHVRVAVGDAARDFVRAKTASCARDLPPAVALALEPRVERAISLDLADVLDQIARRHDRNRLRASIHPPRLAQGIGGGKRMATGKPSVSLATIYQRCRRFFSSRSRRATRRRSRCPSRRCWSNSCKCRCARDQTSERSRAADGDAILEGHARRQRTFRHAQRAVERLGQATGASGSGDRSHDCCGRAEAVSAKIVPIPRLRKRSRRPIPRRPLLKSDSVPIADGQAAADFAATNRRPKPSRRLRTNSVSTFHRMERARPPLREFQPQAGRPFPTDVPSPIRRRVFHSKASQATSERSRATRQSRCRRTMAEPSLAADKPTNHVSRSKPILREPSPSSVERRSQGSAGRCARSNFRSRSLNRSSRAGA